MKLVLIRVGPYLPGVSLAYMVLRLSKQMIMMVPIEQHHDEQQQMAQRSNAACIRAQVDLQRWTLRITHSPARGMMGPSTGGVHYTPMGDAARIGGCSNISNYAETDRVALVMSAAAFNALDWHSYRPVAQSLLLQALSRR